MFATLVDVPVANCPEGLELYLVGEIPEAVTGTLRHIKGAFEENGSRTFILPKEVRFDYGAPVPNPFVDCSTVVYGQENSVKAQLSHYESALEAGRNIARSAAGAFYAKQI